MPIPYSTKSTHADVVNWQCRMPKSFDDWFRKLLLNPGYKQAIVERLLLQLQQKLTKRGVDQLPPDAIETIITELTELEAEEAKVAKSAKKSKTAS